MGQLGLHAWWLTVVMVSVLYACCLYSCCRQQLSTMQERWNALEADATAAREAAEEARAAAGKAEADLAALSTAYNDLEAHAFRLEEQQKQLEQSDLQQQQQAAGLSDAEVEARIKAAVEQVCVVFRGYCYHPCCSLPAANWGNSSSL